MYNSADANKLQNGAFKRPMNNTENDGRRYVPPEKQQKSEREPGEIPQNSNERSSPRNIDNNIRGRPRSGYFKNQRNQNRSLDDFVQSMIDTRISTKIKELDEKIERFSKSDRNGEEREQYKDLKKQCKWLADRIDDVEKSMKIKLKELERQMEEKFRAVNEKIEDKYASLDKNISIITQEQQKAVINSGPQWVVDEKTCLDLYMKSQTQVAQFLADYLPKLFDYAELIAPLDFTNPKCEEAKAVINYFWKSALTSEFTMKEIEKEHKSQKYRITRKIYLALKNSHACIMSNNEQVFECQWNEVKQKYVPKAGEYVFFEWFKWCIPSSLRGEKFVIASETGEEGRSPIFKLDLHNNKTDHLYTKRKY